MSPIKWNFHFIVNSSVKRNCFNGSFFKFQDYKNSHFYVEKTR